MEVEVDAVRGGVLDLRFPVQLPLGSIHCHIANLLPHTVFKDVHTLPL